MKQPIHHRASAFRAFCRLTTHSKYIMFIYSFTYISDPCHHSPPPPPLSAINFHIKRQPCCDKDSRCGIEFVSVYSNNLLWKLHLLILLSAFTQNFILTGCSCEAADTYHLYRWHHNGAKLHCLFISLNTLAHTLFQNAFAISQA